MRESYEKISPTAKLVAYLRTFTDIPFTKEIATKSGAEKAFQELADESAKSMIRLTPRWEARYKVTNRILAERGITQVLEIAAGLSPRGLAMTENPGVVYVASDLPQILEEEKEIAEAILVKLNSERPNLHFQPVNCFSMDSLSTAATAFKHDRPLAIITEGLFPYFTRGERMTLAGNIHELLEKYPGLWITSDVSSKQEMGKLSPFFENVKKRLTRLSSSTESALEDNLFDGENDIKQFFEKAGFKMEEFSFFNVFEDLSSVKILNLTQEEVLKIQQILKIYKTLILTPLNT